MPDKDTEKEVVSEAVENFLKAVYSLQPDAEPRERVSTNALSEHLGITAPSVTDMAQRMTAAGWVDYKRHHGVTLTPAGEALALRVIRRHRLIELYLVAELGYELREVHQEAERLEHAVSDRFIEAVARKLGNPTFDPHGDPIPAADGSIQQRSLLPLLELPDHTTALVRQLKAGGAELLQYVLDRGFKLGARVQIILREPFDGLLYVRIDGGAQPCVIGRGVALSILVEPETAVTPSSEETE
jgi:DtxR family Mn-dependent transcriptional regulator